MLPSLNKEKINCLTIDDMWKLTLNRDDMGIEGYECPKLCKIPKPLPVQFKPKTEDEDGNKIVIKRPNFLDDLFKWANSYSDPVKREELIEELKGKGKDIFEKPDTKKAVKIEYPKRKFFTDHLIRQEQKKYEYIQDDHKQEVIEGIVEKVKEYEKSKKSYAEKTKEIYYYDKQKNYQKGSLPKATRITVVSDAEYVGEKYPFYNTFADPEKDTEMEPHPFLKNKQRKKLFNPSKKPIHNKAPAWSYPKMSKTDEDQAREQQIKDLFKEKEQTVSEAVKDKQQIKSFNINVSEATKKVKKSIPATKMYPKLEKKDNEKDALERYLEQNPKTSVGPQHYWKYPKLTWKQENKKGGPDLPLEDKDGKKTYFKKREATDKFAYKPMKSYFF